ncbi:MAG TPA: hypothetical protein VLF43_01865 [Candidatus Saccharimonadales bacterium]|nr:hypothetical protein [Candidatus Saccharimonadales bacterium]
MQQIKQFLRVGLTFGASLAVFAAGSVASASSLPSTSTVVRGTFQTAADPNCTVPTENCITDQLSGDFVGRNELTTMDYTQPKKVIRYHDQTVITITDGAYAGKQFAGNEHGKINTVSGHFHSCAEFTATDGSGDTLIMHYTGYIDLDNNHDNGQYHGAINSNTHCAWSN